MNIWREWRRRDDSVDPIIQEPRPLRPMEYQRPSTTRGPSSPELRDPQRIGSPRAWRREEASPADTLRRGPRRQGPSGSAHPTSQNRRASSPDFARPKLQSNPNHRRHRDPQRDAPNPNPPGAGFSITAMPGPKTQNLNCESQSPQSPQSPGVESPRRFSSPRQWFRGDEFGRPKVLGGASAVELPGPEPRMFGVAPKSSSPGAPKPLGTTSHLGRDNRYEPESMRRAASGTPEVSSPEPRVARGEPRLFSPRTPRRIDGLYQWRRENELVDPTVGPKPLRPARKSTAEGKYFAGPQPLSSPGSPKLFVSPKHWRRGEGRDGASGGFVEPDRLGATPRETSPRRAVSPKSFALPPALGLGRPVRDKKDSIDWNESKLKKQKKKDKKLFNKRSDRPDGCCNCCGFCTHALALLLILCGDVAVAIATVFYFYLFGIAVAIGIMATIGWIWVTVDMMLGRRGRAAQGFYTCFGLLHSVGIFAVAGVTGLSYFAVITPRNGNGFAPSTYLSLVLFFLALPVLYLCGICFDCVGTRQLLKWSSEREKLEEV